MQATIQVFIYQIYSTISNNKDRNNSNNNRKMLTLQQRKLNVLKAKTAMITAVERSAVTVD